VKFASAARGDSSGTFHPFEPYFLALQVIAKAIINFLSPHLSYLIPFEPFRSFSSPAAPLDSRDPSMHVLFLRDIRG
jgi:hypothetical protein